MQFSSIWPIDGALSGATTLVQSEPGSDCNEEVLHIPQSSSIFGISQLDCLVSYIRTLVGGRSYPLCRNAVGVFHSLQADWVRIYVGCWKNSKP